MIVWPSHVTKSGTVTKGETLVDGIPADDSYDPDTVDLAFHVVHKDDSGTDHSMIEGGVVAVKRAKSADEQKKPGHWWPQG